MKSIPVRQVMIYLSGLVSLAHVYGAQVAINPQANILQSFVQQSTDLLSWRVQVDDIEMAMQSPKGIIGEERAKEIGRALDRLYNMGKQLGVENLPTASLDKQYFNKVAWWKSGYNFLQKFSDSMRQIDSIATKLITDRKLSDKEVMHMEVFLFLRERAKRNNLTNYYAEQEKNFSKQDIPQLWQAITTASNRDKESIKMSVKRWLASNELDNLVEQFKKYKKSKKQPNKK